MKTKEECLQPYLATILGSNSLSEKSRELLIHVVMEEYASQLKSQNVEKVRQECSKFSDTTFGVDRPYTAPLNHLKKEVDEVIQSGDIMEYADCMLLLLDSFNKKYRELHTDVLFQACMKKIEINKSRKWAEPDENGVVEHIRI